MEIGTPVRCDAVFDTLTCVRPNVAIPGPGPRRVVALIGATWTLHTAGAVWNKVTPEICNGAMTQRAYCQSFADLYL